MEFYRCKKCGSIVFNRITKDGLFDSSFHSGIENISNFLKGIDLFPKCCGEDMEHLIPNSTGATPEKHIPQIEFDDNTVKVKIGKESHPMTEEHHIDFIIFETLNTRDQAILNWFKFNNATAEHMLRKDLWPDAWFVCKGTLIFN